MPQINLGRILEKNEGLHDNTKAYIHPAVVQTEGNDWFKTLQDTPIGVTITDQAYWTLAIDNTGNAFDYIVAGAPTATANPQYIGATWVDKQAGEIYICIDITVDNNIWVNQNYDDTAILQVIEENKLGDATQEFLVENATSDEEAVNLEQLNNIQQIITYDLIADTTIAFPTNVPELNSFAIEIATNGFTVTWPAGLTWDGEGIEPEYTAGKDLLFFYTTDNWVTSKGMMTRAGA